MEGGFAFPVAELGLTYFVSNIYICRSYFWHMQILSPHCIQMDTLSPVQMEGLRAKIAPEFTVAEQIAVVQKRVWRHGESRNADPIGERILRPERAMEIRSALPRQGALEIINSRFNAILHCGNVLTHSDKHHLGWTWLTYLGKGDEGGKFYMGGEFEGSIREASLVLPVGHGTSFCFDNQRMHGFDIDLQDKPWVPFLSLIVTAESVHEILENKRTQSSRERRPVRDRDYA